jgi:pimeloyl-ACP methyl ester carboxylesterase
MSATVSPTPITEHELEQVERANATTATPVVFVHGLWLLPSSWENRARLFEEAGYVAVLPLPYPALRTTSVALRNPANWNRAVPLTFEQFRYSFANLVDEDEAKELYLGYSVPGTGEALFQAAAANLNPWSEAKVDTKNPARGPMLIISADSDQTVPWAIANASYKREKRNPGVTEIVKMENRGHSLTIDKGWREVAETALAFVKRFA